MRIQAVVAVAAVLTAAAAARAGDVEGVVRFTGEAPPARALEVTKDRSVCGDAVPDETLLAAGGRLAGVVVVVRGAPPPPPVRAALGQERCRYSPHVQAVPLGSSLEVSNGDDLLHGVHGWSGRMTRFDLPLASKGARATAKLDRAGPVAVRCDVHPWMGAWIVVADGPAAVAGSDGSYAVRGVPPGTYVLSAWHERLGERTAQVTVPASGTVRVDFTFGG